MNGHVLFVWAVMGLFLGCHGQKPPGPRMPQTFILSKRRTPKQRRVERAPSKSRSGSKSPKRRPLKRAVLKDDIQPKKAAVLLFPAPAPKVHRPRRKDLTADEALARCPHADQGVSGKHKKQQKRGERARLLCLLKLRYRRDRRARRLALRIYEESGWISGLEPAQWMEGGWRGRLRIIPTLPMGKERVHLRRLYASVQEFDTFFKALEKRKQSAILFRWRHLAIKFFRTRKRTPSAHALGWDIGYNVWGSLMRSNRSVRRTLFHEMFHLNDDAHRQWSGRVLQGLYDGMIRSCRRRGKVRNACLKKYVPHPTIIKRLGVYYVFHSGSGVVEYAADLALRYFQEHRAILKKRRRYAPYKCRTQENARAWKWMAGEFFGGVDLTARCKI